MLGSSDSEREVTSDDEETVSDLEAGGKVQDDRNGADVEQDMEELGGKLESGARLGVVYRDCGESPCAGQAGAIAPDPPLLACEQPLLACEQSNNPSCRVVNQGGMQ